MASSTLGLGMSVLNRWRRRRDVQTGVALGLVLLGPVLVALTLVALGPLDLGGTSTFLRFVFLADLIYLLAIAAMVLFRIARMIAARRARSAGSRLHLRLTGVFAALALTPTVLVAIFAVLVINIGLEGWFSERVRNVVGSALTAAESYRDQERRDLADDTSALKLRLSQIASRRIFGIQDSDLRLILNQAQQEILSSLQEAFIIDGVGVVRARGVRSYLFDYEAPSDTAIERALSGEMVIIEDPETNEFRALTRLVSTPARLLYVTRAVDGELLRLLDQTQETVIFYQQLEQDRGRRLFEFGLIYLGFALILILGAIWIGMWVAEGLSRPVGRLAGAAQRVGAGDLEVQVPEDPGTDEISMLGRYFNQMTRQLKGQRETLLDNTRQIERRRRLFDSVLSSVTSGVVGLDADGKVAFANTSAQGLLDLSGGEHTHLSMAVPEFGQMLEELRASGREVIQREIRLIRGRKQENLLVRMATRRNTAGQREGYVVAFDDVTDLVSAQRMAAWGDVARRIAHEIKNPLTPIQLSAERIKRKFSRAVGDDADILEQMTDVIVRQTNDLRRIVDEFSKFARMPEPDRRTHDLTRLVGDVVLLQQSGLQNVTITASVPDTPIMARFDDTMIGQALTNLIKNAGEAIETAKEKGIQVEAPEIRVTMQPEAEQVRLCIADNGIGLPADRARLFEPYVTTRDKGTGLGLSIVKKIIEEHGGQLNLLDAPAFAPGAHAGALAEIILPLEPDLGAPNAKEEEI